LTSTPALVIIIGCDPKLSGGKTVYAIIQTGGHQYKVAPGDTIEVERLDAQPGTDVELGEVLMVSGDDGVQIGPKLVVFKFKPKKRYRRKNGHRQNFTRLAIKEINL
jgi:large subunit ribosomal protein L21